MLRESSILSIRLTEEEAIRAIKSENAERIIFAMRAGSNLPRVQEMGCTALGNLSDKNPDKINEIIDSGGMRAVVCAMRRNLLVLALQKEACRVLRRLSSSIGKSRDDIYYIMPSLVATMGWYSKIASLQEDACATLNNIANAGVSNKNTILRDGGINAIVAAMMANITVVAVQESACSALFSLASFDDENDRLKAIRTAGGINAMISSMENNAGNVTVQRMACNSLRLLSNHSDITREAICSADGISAFISAIKHHLNLVVLHEDCYGALIALCTHHTENSKRVGEEGGIHAIVLSMLKHPSETVLQRRAVSLLHTLTSYSANLELLRNEKPKHVISALQSAKKKCSLKCNKVEIILSRIDKIDRQNSDEIIINRELASSGVNSKLKKKKKIISAKVSSKATKQESVGETGKTSTPSDDVNKNKKENSENEAKPMFIQLTKEEKQISALTLISPGAISNRTMDAANITDKVDNLKTFTVTAPPGKNGVILANRIGERGTFVEHIRSSSTLRGKISAGDRIVAVDKEDVSQMSISDLVNVMARKGAWYSELSVIPGPRRTKDEKSNPVGDELPSIGKKEAKNETAEDKIDSDRSDKALGKLLPDFYSSIAAIANRTSKLSQHHDSLAKKYGSVGSQLKILRDKFAVVDGADLSSQIENIFGKNIQGKQETQEAIDSIEVVLTDIDAYPAKQGVTESFNRVKDRLLLLEMERTRIQFDNEIETPTSDIMELARRASSTLLGEDTESSVDDESTVAATCLELQNLMREQTTGVETLRDQARLKFKSVTNEVETFRKKLAEKEAEAAELYTAIGAHNRSIKVIRKEFKLSLTNFLESKIKGKKTKRTVNDLQEQEEEELFYPVGRKSI